MPIRYTIDAERGLIHALPAGLLTLDETLDYFEALSADPLLPPAATDRCVIGSGPGRQVRPRETWRS